MYHVTLRKSDVIEFVVLTIDPLVTDVILMKLLNDAVTKTSKALEFELNAWSTSIEYVTYLY